MRVLTILGTLSTILSISPAALGNFTRKDIVAKMENHPQRVSNYFDFDDEPYMSPHQGNANSLGWSYDYFTTIYKELNLLDTKLQSYNEEIHTHFRPYKMIYDALTLLPDDTHATVVDLESITLKLVETTDDSSSVEDCLGVIGSCKKGTYEYPDGYNPHNPPQSKALCFFDAATVDTIQDGCSRAIKVLESLSTENQKKILTALEGWIFCFETEDEGSSFPDLNDNLDSPDDLQIYSISEDEIPQCLADMRNQIDRTLLFYRHNGQTFARAREIHAAFSAKDIDALLALKKQEPCYDALDTLHLEDSLQSLPQELKDLLAEKRRRIKILKAQVDKAKKDIKDPILRKLVMDHISFVFSDRSSDSNYDFYLYECASRTAYTLLRKHYFKDMPEVYSFRQTSPSALFFKDKFPDLTLFNNCLSIEQLCHFRLMNSLGCFTSYPWYSNDVSNEEIDQLVGWLQGDKETYIQEDTDVRDFLRRAYIEAGTKIGNALGLEGSIEPDWDTDSPL